MTQPQLAAAAGFGLSTVVDFEKSRRAMPAESVAKLRAALEGAGIQFISENGGGAGVRFKLPGGTAQPAGA